jgi:molybdopterin-guanine dinucleotide biosynthesis protein A
VSTLGVVLAGGSSSRFGTDKAAALLGGRTLLQLVCERAAPQVDRLAVNRSAAAAPQLRGDYIHLTDDWPGEGPLAGILAALEYARANGFELLASFPCDAPFFTTGLVNRLREQLVLAKADYCVARSGDYEHHAFALWNAASAPAIRTLFLAGTRGIRELSATLTRAAADFPLAGEGFIADAFLNINTPDDFALAEGWLASHRPK